MPYNQSGLPDGAVAGTDAHRHRGFAFSIPVNTEGGPLKGFEINYQQPFKFLPGVWSNLGVLLNYTYVESKIDYVTSATGATPPITNDLINLSPNAWNATLYYEDGGFSVRRRRRTATNTSRWCRRPMRRRSRMRKARTKLSTSTSPRRTRSTITSQSLSRASISPTKRTISSSIRGRIASWCTRTPGGRCSRSALQILRLMYPLTLSRGWRRVDSRLSTRRLFVSVLFKTWGRQGLPGPICNFSHCRDAIRVSCCAATGQKTWLALMWRSNHFVLFSAGNSENSVTSGATLT